MPIVSPIADTTATAKRVSLLLMGELSCGAGQDMNCVAIRCATGDSSTPRTAPQAGALLSVATAAAKAGDLDRAEAVAGSITDSGDQTSAWGAVARAMAKTGDVDQAVTIADSNPDPYSQAWILLGVGETVSRAGDFDRATTLIMRAKAIARSFADSLPRSEGSLYQRARGLEHSAATAASTVVLDRAEAAAKAGDLDRAETLADSLTSPAWQAKVLASMAEGTTRAGDLERARTLIAHAENIARANTNPYTQASMLVSVVEAMAKVGDLDGAETIADSMDSVISAEDQARALLAVATTQDLSRRARTMARALRIADWHLPIRQLIETAPEALAAVIVEFDAVNRLGAS